MAMTRTSALMTEEGLTRRRLMLAGLGTAVVAFVAQGLLRRRRSVAEGVRWYEVVQDMRRADLWHVNLFAGARLGDLGEAVLVERWTELSIAPDRIMKKLDFPWRVQYSEGPQAQSF